MTELTLYPMQRRDGLALALILLVAALVRLLVIPLMSSYGYDDGTLSLLTLDWLAGKTLPLVGIPSSVNIPNSPMTVYLLALPYALTHDPLLIIASIALWNVLGVGVLWLLARRYLGARVALLAGLAYAVNPFAVLYSVGIWAQDYQTPLLLLGLLTGLLGFGEGKKWAQLVCLPLLLIGMQLHFAAWTLLPLYGWLLWQGRRRLAWGMVLASLGLGVLTLLPFALGLQQQPGEAGARLSGILAGLGTGVTLRPEPLTYSAQLATGLGMENYTALAAAADLRAAVPRPDMLWGLVGLLALAGLGSVWQRATRPLAALLLGWCSLTPLVFIPAWTGSGVHPHYFIPIIPALLLAAALGLDGLSRALARFTPAARPILTTIFIITLLTQGMWLLGAARYTSSRAITTETGNPTSPPLPYLLAVRAALQPYRDVLVIGGNPFYSTDTSIWKPLLYDTATCVRDVVTEESGIAVYPAQPFAVLVPPYATDYDLLADFTRAPEQVLALRPGEPPYRIYAFAAAPAWQRPPITPLSAPRWANGIRLTGYHLDQAQGRMYLRWSVEERLAERNYQYFAHFMDASGARIGQRDSSFYNIGYWCAGDTLITWINATIPPASRALRVGMYSRVADRWRNAELVDEAGQPLGQQWVEVPLE